MTDETTQADPFTSARTNLRETIKWLIAALAALAAAALGSSPLTGFGSLPLGWRLVVATASGVLGLLLVLAAIFVTFRVLIWKPFFLSDVANDTEMKRFIDDHAADLLPPELANFDRFQAERTRARALLLATANQPDAPDRAAAQQFLASTDQTAERLLSLVYFERLRRDFLNKGRAIFVLSLCAMVCLGTFAWASNPGKKADEAQSTTSDEE